MIIPSRLSQRRRIFLLHNIGLKRQRHIPIPIPFIKLILKLNPMQSQRMQKTLHRIHTHQDPKRNPNQHIKSNRHLKIKQKSTIAGVTIFASIVNPDYNVFVKNTNANCECANDNAHRRKYEAVFEIAPKTYSIVSIN